MVTVICPFLFQQQFVFPNRGKGDYFRLGHGTDVHVRKPQMVEGLRGKKIVHVAVGALHCLAVTDTGQVCASFCHHFSTKRIVHYSFTANGSDPDVNFSRNFCHGLFHLV